MIKIKNSIFETMSTKEISKKQNIKNNLEKVRKIDVLKNCYNMCCKNKINPDYYQYNHLNN